MLTGYRWATGIVGGVSVGLLFWAYSVGALYRLALYALAIPGELNQIGADLERIVPAMASCQAFCARFFSRPR